MNKKGAIEMSVGTIVTIVLLMSLLILGFAWINHTFFEEHFEITYEHCEKINLHEQNRSFCKDNWMCVDYASCKTDCYFWSSHYMPVFADDPDYFNATECLEKCEEILIVCEEEKTNYVEVYREDLRGDYEKLLLDCINSRDCERAYLDDVYGADLFTFKEGFLTSELLDEQCDCKELLNEDLNIAIVDPEEDRSISGAGWDCIKYKCGDYVVVK